MRGVVILAAGVVLGLLAGGATATTTSWGPGTPLTPATPAAGAYDHAAIAVNARGDAVAGWVHQRSCCSAGAIEVRSRRGPRGAWGPVTTLSAADASAPRLAMNDAGATVAAWTEGGSLRVA